MEESEINLWDEVFVEIQPKFVHEVDTAAILRLCKAKFLITQGEWRDLQSLESDSAKMDKLFSSHLYPTHNGGYYKFKEVIEDLAKEARHGKYAHLLQEIEQREKDRKAALQGGELASSAMTRQKSQREEYSRYPKNVFFLCVVLAVLAIAIAVAPSLLLGLKQVEPEGTSQVVQKPHQTEGHPAVENEQPRLPPLPPLPRFQGRLIEESDPLLNKMAKFFTTETVVQDMAACLLQNIEPFGKRFVEQGRALGKGWSSIALDTMREWSSKTPDPRGSDLITCLQDFKEMDLIRRYKDTLLTDNTERTKN